MKKFILLLLLTITYLPATAQNKKITVNDIKIFIKQYGLDGYTGKTGRNSIIFYNKYEQVIDMDGNLIPLQEVKILYAFSKNLKFHNVDFRCNVGDCISDSESNMSNLGVLFVNKKRCYEFIALINKLKNQN